MAAQSLNILITGAASGLGRSLALLLSREGHTLILADRNEAGLRETAESLRSENRTASIHTFDVTSAVDVSRFFSELGTQRIDVLVNNAGLQHVAPIDSFPEAQWKLLIDVMLTGPFLLSKAVLPRMRAQGFGRIINIGSIHSLVASPYKAAYVAAKHGMLGLAKVVALETGDANITVNTICPAYVRTPLVDAQIQSQMKVHGLTEEEVIQKIFLEPMPKKAFITSEEVASAALFLMSEGARNITGQTIVIDGGWTVR